MGGVSVSQDELNYLLNVAEDLRVKGLTQGTHEQPSDNSETIMDQLKQEKLRKSSNDHSNTKWVPTFTAQHVKQSPQVLRVGNIAPEALFHKDRTKGPSSAKSSYEILPRPGTIQQVC